MKLKLIAISIVLGSVGSVENFQHFQNFQHLGGIGRLIGLISSQPSLAHESPGHHGGEGHGHSPMEIPDGQPIPQVDLVVHPDSIRGWNLEMRLTHFKLAPEHVNQEATLGEGHAHLYINGEKVTRIYGNWYYLSDLKPGRHQIRVGLTTNDHRDLVHQGQPIEDMEVIEVTSSGS
ncbi:MAG: hypothetical protein HC835_18165 [Oscillatoriales cyanobacterium RM2_1_1]|nr:hypothetical protein [Oscillatoriales cyanobacterium SM2_3_0]NJO47380.1 hypothetical protein [Oscillatoriales cyanobacterium RM2_1_1]